MPTLDFRRLVYIWQWRKQGKIRSEQSSLCKITSYDEEGVPTFAKPVRIPGAVSLSIDAEGEASNFTLTMVCTM